MASEVTFLGIVKLIYSGLNSPGRNADWPPRMALGGGLIKVICQVGVDLALFCDINRTWAYPSELSVR